MAVGGNHTRSRLYRDHEGDRRSPMKRRLIDTLPVSRSPSPSLHDTLKYIPIPKKRSPPKIANSPRQISQSPGLLPYEVEQQEKRWLPLITPQIPPQSPARRQSKATDLNADVRRAAQTEEEKLQDPEYRKKVQRAKRIGHGLALTIAAIDGVITSMAALSIPFLAAGGWPLIILIGLAGFLINRVVYWRSVPDMLKQFIDGFFKGLSKTKKFLISCSMIFAMSLGGQFCRTGI